MKSLFVFAIFGLIVSCMAQSSRDVPYQIIARGQYSGEADQGVKVFRTERALEEFSKEKAQDLPKKFFKDVDWDKEQILVVFAGQQNSGGYGIDIKRIGGIDVQRLVIEAVLTKPSAGQIVTQALTTPYVVIKMARQVAAVKVKFAEN